MTLGFTHWKGTSTYKGGENRHSYWFLKQTRRLNPSDGMSPLTWMITSEGWHSITDLTYPNKPSISCSVFLSLFLRLGKSSAIPSASFFSPTKNELVFCTHFSYASTEFDFLKNAIWVFCESTCSVCVYMFMNSCICTCVHMCVKARGPHQMSCSITSPS